MTVYVKQVMIEALTQKMCILFCKQYSNTGLTNNQYIPASITIYSWINKDVLTIGKCGFLGLTHEFFFVSLVSQHMHDI
jgi:hypothetical protein